MKRTHLKRALSLILALVMVFACLAFTACDDTDGGQTNDGGTDQAGGENKAPKLRVNEETDMWEVSYDDGATWTSLGIKATVEGEAKTPKLQVNAETDLWEVSYDDGVTWTSLGIDATEEAKEPMLRVNPQSTEWEVSYDEGVTWTSLGVKATVEGDTQSKLPRLRVNEQTDLWEISYDDGATWTSLGTKATVEVEVEKVVSVKSAAINEAGLLVITLTDNTKLPPMAVTGTENLFGLADAKEAIAAYKTQNGGSAPDEMLYEGDDLFVAIEDGVPVGAYSTKAAAMQAILDDPATEDDESLAYITAKTDIEGLYFLKPDMAGEKVVDLVIFMGQSNMAGFGGTASEAPVVPEGHGYWFKSISDPTKLYNITEPFGAGERNTTSGLGNCQTNGSMVSAFANAYYENTGVPIVGVFAAQGNTAIDWWQPNGAPLNDAINRYLTAKAWLEDNGYTVRNDFMVWCQGESDGWNGTTKAEYKTKMTAIIDEMTGEGIDACLVVRVGVQKLSTPFDEIIRAQNELCKENDKAVMVCTATAGFAKEGLMNDSVHYTQAGYNKAGTLAGEYAAYYVNNGVKPSMEDARFGGIYDPYEPVEDDEPIVPTTGYKLNTNINAQGNEEPMKNGRIALTAYFECAGDDTPSVSLAACTEQYLAAVKAAGGTDATSVACALRYYDANKNITTKGDHTFVRIVLYVNGSSGQLPANSVPNFSGNLAEGWKITVNGTVYTLTNESN